MTPQMSEELIRRRKEQAREALEMLRARPRVISPYIGLPLSFYQEDRTPEQVQATEDLMVAVGALDEKVQRLIGLLDRFFTYTTEKRPESAPRQQPISRSGLPT